MKRMTVAGLRFKSSTAFIPPSLSGIVIIRHDKTKRCWVAKTGSIKRYIKNLSPANLLTDKPSKAFSALLLEDPSTVSFYFYPTLGYRDKIEVVKEALLKNKVLINKL